MKKVSCILLVEDNHHINYLHQRIIKKLDIARHVKVVRTGEEAIDYLKKCKAGTEPEAFPVPGLIFLDINMPRMNGWEFVEELKKTELAYLSNKTAIIMLTASLNPDDKLKAENMPEVAAFVEKPLNYESLSSIVEKWVKE